MSTVEEQLDLIQRLQKGAEHALLNRAAYGKNFVLNKKLSQEILIDAKVPPELVPEIQNNYTVVAQFESLNGAAATVFQHIESGERSLVIRGMDPTELTDLAAGAQIAFGVPPTLNHQFDSLAKQTQQWIDEGVLPQRFEASGYSLGGYEVVALKQVFPEHITHTYSFLEPGIGGLAGELVEWMGGTMAAVPDVTIFTSQRAIFSFIDGLGFPQGETLIRVSTDNDFLHDILTLRKGILDTLSHIEEHGTEESGVDVIPLPHHAVYLGRAAACICGTYSEHGCLCECGTVGGCGAEWGWGGSCPYFCPLCGSPERECLVPGWRGVPA